MQYDHVLKKMNFDPTPMVGGGGGGMAGGGGGGGGGGGCMQAK